MTMSTANQIGARLRHERQTRGMSLRSVAHALGVSPSLISQVETGKTQPSVATLYAFASLMAVSVDRLLGIETNRSSTDSRFDAPGLELQRRDENPIIEMENGVRWERLAMGRNGPADALLVTYSPHASSSLEGKLMRHAGVEYAYLLSGVITLHLEFDTFELRAGDSLHFDSLRPHMFANYGSEPATGVWFVVGRREADAPRRGNPEFSHHARSAVDVLQRLDALDDA